MSDFNYYITPEEYEEAAANGISKQVLERRIRNSVWDREKALTDPPREKKDRRYWAKIAEANGIGYLTFLSRVNHLDWPEEKAATDPIQDKSKHAYRLHDANRKYKKELVALAAQNDIAYHTYVQRVQKGMDEYEAAVKPTMTPKEKGVARSEKRKRYRRNESQ